VKCSTVERKSPRGAVYQTVSNPQIAPTYFKRKKYTLVLKEVNKAFYQDIIHSHKYSVGGDSIIIPYNAIHRRFITVYGIIRASLSANFRVRCMIRHAV